MKKLMYNRTAKDAYQEYARSLLKLNPKWWGKYDQKIPNFRVYKRVDEGHIVEVISYPRFKRMLDDWFKGAKKYIIQGRSLALGGSLGRIEAVRADRNFGKLVVNWKATKQMWEKKEERKGLIYFTDEEWVRIGWFKTGHVKNLRFYRFSPAEGNNRSNEGFKKAFSLENKKDPLLKYKYIHKPFITND